MSKEAEEAKQERRKDSDKKRSILVEYDGKYYIVKNEGDEAKLYESEQRREAIKFAEKMAKEHNVELILGSRVKDREDDAARNKDSGPSGSTNKSDEEKSGSGRKYEEKDGEGRRNILVEDDGRYYIVRNDSDRAKLYESEDKEATLEFARKIAQEHEVDLVMLDRDGHVQLEEKYDNGNRKEPAKGPEVKKENGNGNLPEEK